MSVDDRCDSSVWTDTVPARLCRSGVVKEINTDTDLRSVAARSKGHGSGSRWSRNTRALYDVCLRSEQIILHDIRINLEVMSSKKQNRLCFQTNGEVKKKHLLPNFVTDEKEWKYSAVNGIAITVAVTPISIT